MPTGWPLEARLHLIHELYLVIGTNTKVHQYDNAQKDVYWLIKAIINDDKFVTYSRSRLIQIIKRSPIWEKASQFLANGDKSCAATKCNGQEEDHRNGKCNSKWCGTRYSWNRPKDYKCPCKEFKPKKL